MKRHDRPYGCTFLGCAKSFGSKNDWIRHEDTQHFQKAGYSCDTDVDGATCNMQFGRRQDFHSHLKKCHEMRNPQDIQDRIDKCRQLANECPTDFWCGFCAKVIPLHMVEVGTRSQRANHIDNHFMGRNGYAQRSVKEWKYQVVEASTPKGPLATKPLAVKKSRTTKRVLHSPAVNTERTTQEPSTNVQSIIHTANGSSPPIRQHKEIKIRTCVSTI